MKKVMFLIISGLLASISIDASLEDVARMQRGGYGRAARRGAAIGAGTGGAVGGVLGGTATGAIAAADMGAGWDASNAELARFGAPYAIPGVIVGGGAGALVGSGVGAGFNTARQFAMDKYLLFRINRTLGAYNVPKFQELSPEQAMVVLATAKRLPKAVIMKHLQNFKKSGGIIDANFINALVGLYGKGGDRVFRNFL